MATVGVKGVNQYNEIISPQQHVLNADQHASYCDKPFPINNKNNMNANTAQLRQLQTDFCRIHGNGRCAGQRLTWLDNLLSDLCYENQPTIPS